MDGNNLPEVVTIGDYIVKSKIGGGGGGSLSATVWKAEHRSSGGVVALKRIHLSKLTRSLKDCLECELRFLSSVNHPNIIRLLDVFETEGCIFLVLEFCTGGNLASYIHNHGRVEECTAQKFMQQLGAGLEVLHKHQIVHRDLKPEGLLLLQAPKNWEHFTYTYVISCFHVGAEFYIRMTWQRWFVDLPYTWLQKFYISKDMMEWLTCGVSVQFFLSFLMVIHLSMVGLVCSLYRILRHVKVFLFPSLSFLSCMLIVLTCVRDYYLSIQRSACLSVSFIGTAF